MKQKWIAIGLLGSGLLATLLLMPVIAQSPTEDDTFIYLPLIAGVESTLIATTTPTATPSASATPSPTLTETATAVVTVTSTATISPSSTSLPTATQTDTPTATPSATVSPTTPPSATATTPPTVSPTVTNTVTPSATATETPSVTLTTPPTATATTLPTATPNLAYYVATNGDDANPGSLAQPWRTIQHAANTLQAGEVVYVRGGVYTEQVIFNVSGSHEMGYITFQNYPHEQPIVDGSNLTVPSDSANGLFYLADQHHLIIQGFELRNYKSNIRHRVPIGLYIEGQAHHLEIRDNIIHHIETNASVDGDLASADAHGLAIYGTDGDVSINHITIDGNELYDLKLGSSEALVLNGNVELFTITNNIVHDSDNIGIDLIGFEETSPNSDTDQARAGVVISNTVYNIDTITNPAYDGERSAGGIYVDGGTNILIERNRVYSSNIGIEIASEHQGRATDFITVRNNWLYNNHLTGLAMGGYDKKRGQTTNCLIINNTFYNNDTLEDGNGELLIQYATQNNVIKNNIFYADNEQSWLIGNIYPQTNNVVDYNIYYAPAGAEDSEWFWENEIYQGFAEYQANTGNDAHGMFINPQLVEPTMGELHLSATSPAIDAGETLSELGEVDIDGETRIYNGVVDIGADEWQ